MGLFKKKKSESPTVSDSTVRIIKRNLNNIGVTVPLSEEDLSKIFNWLVAQQERCTGNSCSIKLDGGTTPEVNLAVQELNPYSDKVIDFGDLNKRLK